MKAVKEQFFYYTGRERKKRIVVSIIVTVAIFAVLFPFLWGFLSDFIPIYTYKYSPEEFASIHGMSTSEFLGTSPKKRFASSAPYFDKDGNFIIRLTYNENKDLISAAKENKAKALKFKSINISEDYKIISVGAYRESFENENFIRAVKCAITACNYFQLTDKVKPCDICVMVQYYDMKTNQIIYDFVYGAQEISIDPENFSEK